MVSLLSSLLQAGQGQRTRSAVRGETRPERYGKIAFEASAHCAFKRWPSNLAKDKKRYFVQKTSKGTPGLWRKRAKKKAPRLYWVFVKRVKITPIWPFEETIDRVAKLRWEVAAKKALMYAIETAIRKSGVDTEG